MKIKVKVTQGMINRDCHTLDSCPINDALKLFIKQIKYISVEQFVLTIRDKEFSNTNDFVHYFNDKISTWIRTYDYDISKVKPLSFTIEVPDRFLRKSVLQNK